MAENSAARRYVVAQKKLKKLGTAATAMLALSLLACPGTSSAQGFSGLSQLFGGSSTSSGQGFGGVSQLFGGGSMHSKNSSRSSGAVTVERSSAPYVGSFDGKQKKGSGADLNAEFACYPAHDSALPDTNAFVCYTAEAPSNPRPDD